MKILKRFLLFLTFSILSFIIITRCIAPKYYYDNQYSAYDLKGGKYIEDTSHIYSLPYKKGESYLLVQAYESTIFSHQGEAALDFKMKTGTPIMAARSGKVIQVEDKHNEGGLDDNYLSKGNHVVIEHNDGSYAGYWHFKHKGTAVEVGEQVKVGDLLGYCGNTGYSAFPHLHFWVYDYNGDNGTYQTLPTRFYTKKGVKYLRPGLSYKHN